MEANMNVEESIPVAKIEEVVVKVVESRLQQALEEYVERNELRIKEFSLMERVIRVEEELRSLREMSEIRFEAMDKRFESLLREMNARFETVDKRFETMDKRFETIDKRFESLLREMNARFEAQQREMNARFETVDKRFDAMDKRFSAIQWLIGILVGIPALAITFIQILKII
jgi:chaperonin cofactor prefoldin